MKKFLLLATAMVTSCHLIYSQSDSTARSHIKEMSMNDYYLKGKRQTQTAFVLAGTGIALGSLGIALFRKITWTFPKTVQATMDKPLLQACFLSAEQVC